MNTQILQLIPADGWDVVYTDRTATETRVPLVAWALVERDGVRSVVGLDVCDIGEVYPCDRDEYFSRYEAPSAAQR